MIFGKARIKSENDEEEFVIRFTDRIDEQKNNYDDPIYILYVSEKLKEEERNPLADGVLKALAKEERSFEIVNNRTHKKYYIDSIEDLDEIMKYNYHKKRVIDFTIITPPPIIYVYSSAGICKRCEHNGISFDLETVIAKVKAINLNNNNIIDCLLRVTYCKKCDTYFINMFDLKGYEKRYQAILIQKSYEYVDDWEDNYYYYAYNKDSILSRYGYKADGSQNSDCRHRIIDFIISIDEQNAYKIRHHLIFLIDTRKNMVEAQARWQEDCRYVQRIIHPKRYIGEATLH